MSHVITLDTIPGFESVHRFEDKSIEAIAFIARHSSALGTPLGGCRLRYDYRDESDCLADALRLSEGMTRKAAIHRLPLGGGKMAVWSRRPLAELDRKAMFEFVGLSVDKLGGSYITAEDLNTTVADMMSVRTRTAHVAGIDSGDPSEFTALGVWEVIRHLAENRLSVGTTRCRLAVQGVGKVGEILVRLAAAHGVTELIISDLVPERAAHLASEIGCRVVGSNEIYDVPCDVFVPCGCGGILNPRTIPRLRCSAVAGAANNQLADPERDEELLQRRGILYCPDVVVNGGGLINVSCEFPRYDCARAERLTRGIPATLEEVLEFADRDGISATAAVNALTDQRNEKPRPRFDAPPTSIKLGLIM